MDSVAAVSVMTATKSLMDFLVDWTLRVHIVELTIAVMTLAMS